MFYPLNYGDGLIHQGTKSFSHIGAEELKKLRLMHLLSNDVCLHSFMMTAQCLAHSLACCNQSVTDIPSNPARFLPS